jgi:hypothetical protein
MSTQGSPRKKKKPASKPSPKNDFPQGPEQNRGPSQKIDRAHPVAGARRVNRPQGR